MKIGKIFFTKIIQDSQEYGSDDEHMVSRVFFDLEIGDERFENLYCDIKQTAGSNYESHPIEIGLPKGYKGSLNYQSFRGEVEKCYRSSFGKDGSGIRMGNGSSGRMYNTTFIIKKTCQIKIENDEGGW